MAISYRIDSQQAMIFAAFADTITDSDSLRYFEILVQDAAFDPNFGHLVDCSKITSLKISAAGNFRRR